MDRIESVGDSSLFKRPERKRKDKKQLKGISVFSDIVGRVEEAEGGSGVSYRRYYSEEDSRNLEELLDEVSAMGEKLAENPTIDNIKEYKKRVGDFINYIVNKAVILEERVSGLDILKRKRFTLVKIIDRKLEQLAAEVLRNQRDQLMILEKVEEINGMLVDLLS